MAGVSLIGGKFAATRDVKGMLDWKTLFAVTEGSAAPKPAAAEAAVPMAPWKTGVREIKLAEWAARFTDHGDAQPLSVDAAGVGLTAALAGEVGATLAIEIGPVNAALAPIRVRSGAQQVAELQRAALVNAGLKLADRQLVVEAVELSGAKITKALDKKKQLNWTGILQKAPGAPAAAPASPAESAAPGFNVHLARLSLDGIEVGIVDQSPDKPVRLDVVQGFATLRALSLDMSQAVPLEAGFALKQGGRFNADGTVVPGMSSGQFNLRLVGLSLKPFAPYVNQFARLKLHSGAASTRGKLAFEPAKSGRS